jgi:DegV family protein with EDD domain
MSKKVAVVTDSISCLNKELIDQYGIIIVPIRLHIQGKIYRDSVDMTPSEAYEFFLQDPERFNTSPASPGHYLEAYQEASKMANGIICITLSSHLSTGYEMASIAMENAKQEMPELTIKVMDSRNVTAAEGFVALAAARAAEEGKDLEEAIKAAEEVRDKVRFMAVLETIRYVYRTGRIPKVAASVGSMLNIKPILANSSGKIKFVGAVRDQEKGVDRILKAMSREVGQSQPHIAVMHAYVPEEAEKLKERIASEFDCAELWISEFTPVMGYATGTGTLAVAFYAD